jgi:putative aminopeptidase FrvX
MKNFRKQLIDLLTIQAPSGQEHKVRNYLQPHLAKLVDNMFVDKKGNLLAEKKFGDGNGATIMLSAHMDSVRDVRQGRKIIEKDGILTASKGVLGADDRAGIAIIMTVLRNLQKIDFSGNVKIAFCVEEEIGCVGSDAMDKEWYKDVNLAIVVDRRGNRDIVTGCGSPWNFCSKAVGTFLEDCSALLGMDWKAVGGGVSDAMTFSGNGVHSVNLSAGYRNEHTEKESMNIKEGMDTINLILQAFALVNGFYTGFGEVPAGYSSRNDYYDSKWVNYRDEEDYWTGKSSGAVTATTAGSSSKYFDDELIFETKDGTYGDVSLSDIGGYMSIFQDGNKKYANQEIWMARGDFDAMVNAYLKTKGFPDMSAMLTAKARVAKEKAAKATKAADALLAKADAAPAPKHFTTNTKGELVKV